MTRLAIFGLLGLSTTILVACASLPEADPAIHAESAATAPREEPTERTEWVEHEHVNHLNRYYPTGELKGRGYFMKYGRLAAIEEYDKTARVRFAMDGVIPVVFDASAMTADEFARIREQSFADHFRKVYIRGNANLDARAIDALLTLPNLEEVHISECPNIPADALERLKRERPRLTFEP